MSVNPVLMQETFTQLTTTFFKKEFISNIRNLDNNYAVFVKGDLVIGTGINNISRGFLTPTDFSDTNPNRVPTANMPEVYLETLSDEVKLVYINTITKQRYYEAFASQGELASFIQQQQTRLQYSLNLNLSQMISYLFGEVIQDDLSTLTQTQKTQLDKIKTTLTSTNVNATLPTLNADDLELHIREQSYLLTKFLKENSAVKTVPATVPINEQVLVISNKLYQRIITARKTQYNPTDVFKLFYKVIVLNYDSDVYYLFDKEAIRFYPRFNTILTQEYNARLEMDYYLHYWMTMGVYKSFAIKKFTLTTSEKA